MGRYIHGSGGFTYKYIFAQQNTNLSQLADWCGVESVGWGRAIFTQFFAWDTAENRGRFEHIDGASNTIGVFEATIPGSAFGLSLSDDVEEAIYQVCDQWSDVVEKIEETLPGPALGPDLALVARFNLRREDWKKVADKIGHGADPTDSDSLRKARDIVFESGEDGYLPLIAINALLHAVENELDLLELVDGEQGETNLWSVAEDSAFNEERRDPDGMASWEKQDALSRVYAWQYDRRHLAEPLLKKLLEERPESVATAGTLFKLLIWDERWEEIGTLAGSLLEKSKAPAARTEYYLYRGEAMWAMDRMEEAEKDARAAADLGSGHLLEAIQRLQNLEVMTTELIPKLELEITKLDAIIQTEGNSKEIEKATLEKLRIELVLEQIEDGFYGLCSGCYEQLPIERLKAEPLLGCESCESEDSI